MKRLIAVLPLLALAVLAGVFIVKSLHRDPQVVTQAMVGKPLPDVALPSLDDGQTKRLRELAGGREVLVNFFASWCVPCEVEHPQLRALQAEGVPIIGVAWKDEPDKAKGFLSRLGDPFVARLVDRDATAGVEFGVSGVPETYLVGPDGRILAKHAAPLTPADAEALLEAGRR